VPDELGSRIIDLREEHGAFRRNTYIEPMASDTKSITRQTGGMTAYFVGEGDDHTESDMSFDTIKLEVKKLVAATRISSELEEDAIISVADRFAMDAAKALALKEDQCGFNGDGAQTFAGIFGVCNKMEANTGFAGVYTLSPIDSFAEVDNTHIATVMAALPGYVLNPKWYVSSAGWAMVFQRLAIAANGNTLSQLQGGPITRSYLGYPIELVQVMTTSLTATGTNGKTMFMFGDLAEASTLGDRRGLTLKRSDEKYWSSDEIAMKATERFDINVHDIGDATDAGPLVGMVGLT
jgi:HK97 family phage major capsid protein